MTVEEVLSLDLAMSPTKFVAVPLALLIEIVLSCDLIMLNTNLVLAEGQLCSRIRWGHILCVQGKQDYTAQFERLCA